jgi:hypothetical protein
VVSVSWGVNCARGLMEIWDGGMELCACGDDVGKVENFDVNCAEDERLAV